MFNEYKEKVLELQKELLEGIEKESGKVLKLENKDEK